MYDLLHYASAFATQLEAAGLPEGAMTLTLRRRGDLRGATRVTFAWWTAELFVRVHAAGDVEAADLVWTYDPDAGEEIGRERILHTFRVGEPLPDALVTAIMNTESGRVGREPSGGPPTVPQRHGPDSDMENRT